MALQTTTTIFINRTQIPTFKSLELKQTIGFHHELKIVCRMDVLENSEGEIGSVSREYLGELITVETEAVAPYEGAGTFYFKGIVRNIKMIKGHAVSSGDQIIITAVSPSILADDGPHYASHNDVSLSGIIAASIEGYSDKFSLTTNIQDEPTLHYSVQHNESCFQYINRLSAQFGQWFFYDGRELIFGAPGTPDKEPTTLIYGFDLKEYQMSLAPQSSNYTLFAKDYLTDDNIEASLNDLEAELTNDYSRFLSSKSSSIFNKPTKVWHNLYNDTQTQQRLNTVAMLQKKSIELQQFKVTGVSHNPGVTLGNIIVIEGVNYRVTSLIHINNEIGDYENKFEAIVADIDASPLTNINAMSRAESQIAIVKENADPDGIGRVKVQFPWQEDSELTPWLRIITPHGGLNKGFHFIPELEEEVLVGFEGGNAEKPYVLGSLFNITGKVDEFQTETNDAKIIRTRSGHTIELNDTDGEEKINIYDNEGSIITFDTQAKSLTINATETIDIAAKNINISAEENITIGAQGNIEVASDGDTALQAQGAMDIQATGDASLTSSGAVTVEAASDATLTGANTVVSGQASAELSGTQAKVAGSAMAEVSGGIVKIN